MFINFMKNISFSYNDLLDQKIFLKFSISRWTCNIIIDRVSKLRSAVRKNLADRRGRVGGQIDC
jgi:hypothetical protein